jgi:hypothetical protein
MAIDLINRCRTAAAAYRTNAEPHIGSTVDLSARDVMAYAALLDEAAAELERMCSERAYIVGCNDGFETAIEQAALVAGDYAGKQSPIVAGIRALSTPTKPGDQP